MICISKWVIRIIHIVYRRVQVKEIGEKQLERVAAGIKLDPKRKTWVWVISSVPGNWLIIVKHQRSDGCQFIPGGYRDSKMFEFHRGVYLQSGIVLLCIVAIYNIMM